MTTERSAVVITGASRGVGAALASYLLARDRVVHGFDVNPADTALGSKPGYRHTVVDITDEQSLDAAIDAVWSEGSVGAVVANAAVTDIAHRLATDLPYATWQHIMRTNVDGAFLTARLSARRMAQQRFGNLVFVTSSLAKIEFAQANDAPYCASKAAVEMLSKVLALELRDLGINVNTVFPSVRIDTGFFSHLTEDERSQLSRPDIMNAAIGWLIDLPPGRLTGQSIDHERLQTDAGYCNQVGFKLPRGEA